MKPKEYFLSGKPFKIIGDNTGETYQYNLNDSLLRVISNRPNKIFIVVKIGSKGFTIRVFGVITSHPEFISFRNLLEQTAAGLSEETTVGLAPEIATMNQIFKNIQMLMDSIETKISFLEKEYNKASERWQKSENGKVFRSKATFLNQIVEQLSDWSDELIYN